MNKILAGLIAIALLGAGGYTEIIARAPAPTPMPAPDPRIAQTPPNASGFDPGEVRFEIDISSSTAVLERLSADERREQIADWAVYGTLLRAGLGSDAIRDATYSTSPVRLPHLASILDFDYGRGRRVLLRGDRTWLFYSEFDTNPGATLARLADQVRMETGAIPNKVEIFSYKLDVARGAIAMTREKTAAGSTLFTPEFGYVEARIADASELEQFLNQIDDLTHVDATGSAIALGGRRFKDERTGGVSIDDVAALYQAHRTLISKRGEVDTLMRAATKPLDDAYQELLDAFNANVNQYNANNYAVLSVARFDNALSRVKALLGSAGAAFDREAPARWVQAPTDEIFDVQKVLRELRNGRGLSADYRSQDFQDLLARQIPSSNNKGTIEHHRSIIEHLQPRVQTRIETLQRERYRELSIAERIPPGEPGFSLDPQWHTADLVSDLKRLIDAPRELVAMAHKVDATITEDPRFSDGPIEREVSARSVVAAFDNGRATDYAVPKKWRATLRKILAQVHGKSGRELEERALVPFLELKEELKAARGDAEAYRLLSLLDFLESMHRAQCARYDGPLAGTHVGMNLFYTDLLAKLWAAIDYQRAAPTEAVFGFRSGPVEGPSLEPLYWDEVWRFPATRLWFGTKPASFKGSPEVEDGLNFAHVATRVYAAGSNPLNPGKEVTANEKSGRVFDWWDRHYAAVADHEQAYHIQNQIMKWSVVTGWLAEHNRLTTLESVEVYRQHRFDHWYADNAALRFRDPVPFLDVSKWRGNRECLQILRSYYYPSAGLSSTYTEGGVSLGSGRSLNSAARVSRTVPKHLRRGAMNAEHSARGKLHNLRGVAFNRPAGTARSARIHAEIPTSARLRGGPSELRIAKLNAHYEIGPNAGRIGLGTERGSLGRLEFTRTENGVRLNWNDGPVSNDGLVLAAFSRNQAANGGAGRIAAHPSLQPHRGGYVIESDAGQVTAFASGGGGGAKGPPRVFRTASPDEPLGPHAFLRNSTLEPAWKRRLLIGQRPRKHTAEVAVVDEQTMRAAIDASPWQRIRPLDEASTGQIGALERVFTAKAPSVDAKPVMLETNSALGQIRALVDDTGVYLARPSDVALHARFNTIVTDLHLTGETLGRTIKASRRGVSEAALSDLGPFRMVGYRRGIDAAELAQKGDYRRAAKELHAAAKDGDLKGAVESYKQRLSDDITRPLVEGERIEAARLLVELESVPASEKAVANAVVALRRSDTNAAAHALETAVREAEHGLSANSLTTLRTLGQRPAYDYALLKAGKMKGVHPNVADKVSIRPDGFRVHTQLPRAAAGRWVPTDASVRANVARTGGEFYIDRALLNRLDWLGAPGPSLEQALRMPGVRLHVLEGKTLGNFRPSMLSRGTGSLEGGGRGDFLRHDVPPSPRLRVRAPLRTYMLASCEETANETDNVADEVCAD